MPQSGNILTHYIPIGGMIVIVSAAIWLGQKVEKLEALNENITTYMETYNAVRFVNLERDIKENLEDDLSFRVSFKENVIGVVREEFFNKKDQ